jgi:3-oxoacid CoA-transferase subunit B
MAMRVAKELVNKSYVNLGIGIPTLVSDFVSSPRSIIFQSENGLLNYGPLANHLNPDVDLVNAGGQFLENVPGMSFFSSDEAFAMIRGGHIDVSVMGAMQVSEKGDLANWMLPKRGVGNIGGAMDLAVGAKQVIVAMEHTDKENNPKLVTTCSFPLTGKDCVHLVITDLAVIEVTSRGLLVKELAPDWTLQDVQDLTEPCLIPSADLKPLEL